MAAKLHQPSTPARYVRRPLLVQRLNEGLEMERPLTLISAPAGFGKTTCVSEWLAGVNACTTWLSLDKADDDPKRFLTYFTAALQKVDAGIGSETAGVLQSGEMPAIEVVVANLSGDIMRIANKIILVLDDFQVIQDRSILHFVELVIANLLGKLHLAIVTREDPLLPLARLRAKNQLTEIRGGDLRFHEPEIGQFMLEMLGVDLSTGDIQALESRTEGWAAGLQLAGLSLRGKADPSTFIAGLSGSHRFILSYLTEEVLNQQNADVQSFLLQTSILDRLNGELCDAVSGRSDSAELLERLYNANLFLVPLDDVQNWYRYHHLFADLLRSQQSRAGGEQTRALHQRASRWYAQAGMVNEAIQHALAGEEYSTAVELVESQAMIMIMQGYAKTVEGWVEAIPEAWHSRSPRANLAMAWMHLLRGTYEKIGPYSQAAKAGIDLLDPTDPQKNELQGEWLALGSNLANVQGRIEQSIAMAEEALRCLPPAHRSVRGMAYLGLGGAYRLNGDYPHLIAAYQNAISDSRAVGNYVPEMLAVTALIMMAFRHGQLRFAVETANHAIQRIERAGVTPPIAGTVYGTLGLVYYEWNQLDEAREHIARGEYLARLSGHNAGLVYTRVQQARIAGALGDFELAGRLIQEANDRLQYGVPVWLKPEVIYQQARTYLALRNPAAAAAAIESLESAFDFPMAYPLELLHLARLHLLLYNTIELGQTGQAEEGIRLANRLIADAELVQRNGTVLQALLLRALFYEARGEQAESQRDVVEALRIGDPEGYVRSFVDLGPVMAMMLHRARSKGAYRGYIDRLLEAFPGLEHTALERQPQKPLVEPLSEREIEVLRWMAEGLKYEEIAEQMVVSLNTVRFHVKSLYRKLGVNSRTKAIEAGRSMGII